MQCFYGDNMFGYPKRNWKSFWESIYGPAYMDLSIDMLTPAGEEELRHWLRVTQPQMVQDCSGCSVGWLRHELAQIKRMAEAQRSLRAAKMSEEEEDEAWRRGYRDAAEMAAEMAAVVAESAAAAEEALREDTSMADRMILKVVRAVARDIDCRRADMRFERRAMKLARRERFGARNERLSTHGGRRKVPVILCVAEYSVAEDYDFEDLQREIEFSDGFSTP